MVPNKELQELARALLRTEEYNEMMKHRSKIMGHPMLGRQMMVFEREQMRLANSNLPAADVSARMKRLMADNKDFMEREEIKNYIASASLYQKMIGDCINSLNKALDTRGNLR